MPSEKYYRHLSFGRKGHTTGRNAFDLNGSTMYSTAKTPHSDRMVNDDSDTYSGVYRRAAHNALERQRREYLNSKFQELAHALPSLQSIRRPSKSMIVTKSLEFVSNSIHQEKNFKNQIAHLCEENKRLRKQAAESGHILRTNLERSSPLLKKAESTQEQISPPATPVSADCESVPSAPGKQHPQSPPTGRRPSNRSVNTASTRQSRAEVAVVSEPVQNTVDAAPTAKCSADSPKPISKLSPTYPQDPLALYGPPCIRPPVFNTPMANNTDRVAAAHRLNAFPGSMDYPQVTHDTQVMSTAALTTTIDQSSQPMVEMVNFQCYAQSFAEYEQYPQQRDPFAFSPPSYSHAMANNVMYPAYQLFSPQANTHHRMSANNNYSPFVAPTCHPDYGTKAFNPFMA